jgi:hypothetical protein
MSNVLFINGWGGALTSFSLAGLRNRTIAKFKDSIYAPPPVDYTDESSLMRYLDKWKDIQILVMLSCGCSAGNKIAAMRPNEVIPYAMYYSPSRRCGFLGFPVPKNIAKATQVTSNKWDWFNLGAAMITFPAKGNATTKIDEIYTGDGHGFTPGNLTAQERLWREIEATLKGKVNPNRSNVALS